MCSLAIDFHPSTREESLQQEAIASLQANRIDPKFLYVTPRQSEAWRQVFLRHSPIHGNPEFSRIYREAFTKVAARIGNIHVLLVGLGCGTGQKEHELASILRAKDTNVLFAAVDVSQDLVRESAQKLNEAGAEHRCSLVSDLTQADFIRDWLDRLDDKRPRLLTFFGVAPNFAPSAMTRLMRTLLRPGDLLFASAHLVPAENAGELPAAMASILPQYRNPETLAWLTAALKAWELEELVSEPEMNVSELEGIAAFLGTVRWKSDLPFERWGHHFTPRPADSLQLFFSLRYTIALFEDILRRDGLQAELLSITACRQEAIWCVRLA